MDDRPTFEETYPRYPFAPLVHAGLVAGRYVLRLLHLTKAPRPAASHTPGKTELYAD
jgi:hypothetical protein